MFKIGDIISLPEIPNDGVIISMIISTEDKISNITIYNTISYSTSMKLLYDNTFNDYYVNGSIEPASKKEIDIFFNINDCTKSLSKENILIYEKYKTKFVINTRKTKLNNVTNN